MKDYYRTLGVLDDAEDIVIRAAYKALAQKYHPDKWKGDVNDAHRRMSDINEAFGILSVKEKRQQYDSEYFKQHQRNEAQDEENSDQANFISEEDEAWLIAVEFYPQLHDQYTELTKISAILGNTFKAALIQNKNFSQSQLYKETLEQDYIERYYGQDIEIQKLAKMLLLINYKKEAIYVNKIVRVMGASITYAKLYKKLLSDHPRLKNDDTFLDRAHISLLLENLYCSFYSPWELAELYERFFGESLSVDRSFMGNNFSNKQSKFNQAQLINVIAEKIKIIYKL